MRENATRIVYHGSNVEVPEPEIRLNGFAKDFGYGFYCTDFERQAQRWSLTRRPQHIVSVYSCLSFEALSVCSFPQMSDAWLDFVVDCRRGKTHDFDVVEGPMADDTIWNYVEDFAAGDISRAAFWELVKFKYPTHQIAFCSNKALSCLTYRGSYTHAE